MLSIHRLFIKIFIILLTLNINIVYALPNQNLCAIPSSSWIITYFINLLWIEDYVNMYHTHCNIKKTNTRKEKYIYNNLIQTWLKAEFAYLQAFTLKQNIFHISDEFEQSAKLYFNKNVPKKYKDELLSLKNAHFDKRINVIKKYLDNEYLQHLNIINKCYINSTKMYAQCKKISDVYNKIQNKKLTKHQIETIFYSFNSSDLECIIYHAFINPKSNSKFIFMLLDIIINNKNIISKNLDFFSLALSLNYFNNKEYASSLDKLYSINPNQNVLYKLIYNHIQTIYAKKHKSEGRVGLNPSL